MVFKRLVGALTCIAVLLTACAGALGEEALSALQLPQKLTTIRQEAFADTENIESVIVPEGTKRIEARAFANSSAVQIHLPVSVEYIADDAFEGCGNLTVFVHRDSYAHEWIALRDIRYSIVEPESDDPDAVQGEYAVHSVEYAEETADGAAAGSFNVLVSTIEACDVSVILLNEAETETLYSFSSAAEGGLDYAEVGIGCGEAFALPENYVLKAQILRGGEAMCDAYVSRENTESYRELYSKTEADYADREVIALGSAGYAVLAEGVTSISGASVSGTGYTFSASGVKKGDVLMLEVGGVQKAVKVASVTANGDGTVTVQPDDSITLSEAFDRLQIDGCMEPEGITSKADGDLKIIPLSPGFTYGPVEVKGTMQIIIKMKVLYDKESDFFEMECWAETDGQVEVILKSGFNTRDFEVNPLRIPLYNAGVKIPKTDIEAMLTVSVPLDVNLEVGGSAYFKVNVRTGFSYNSTDKQFRKLSDKSGEAYAKVVGKVTATFGPEIMLKAELMDMLDAKIWGQIGLEATGELTGLQYGGSVSEQKPDSIHACDACLDCDINFIAGVWGTLEYDITEKIKGKFLDSELLVLRAHLGDAHYSIENEVESPYGGSEHAAFTACENVKYRTDVATADYLGRDISGIKLTSTGAYGTVQEGVSPCTFYLYEGSNKLAAAFDSGVEEKTFYKNADASSMYVEEKPVSLLVTVRESDLADEPTYTPIVEADITLTLPDGTKKSAMSGMDGTYQFAELPGGKYTITVTPHDHKAKTITAEYTPGTGNSAVFTYEPNKFPYIYASTSSGYATAVTESGILPNYVSKVQVNIKKDKWGMCEYVSVKHEDCAEEFVYEAATGWDATIEGANMGTDEYIYILSIRNTGTGGGCENIILRVRDGAFEIVGKFNYDDDSWDKPIYVSAKFTSSTKFSGTIYPTKTKFSGTKTKDGADRTGMSIWRNRLGFLSFEKNEDDYYDMIFATSERCYTNADGVGATYTRFAMENGSIVMKEQRYESY